MEDVAKSADRSPHKKTKKANYQATDEVVAEIRALPIFKSASLIDLVNSTGVSRSTLNRHTPLSISTRESLISFLERKREENMETEAKIRVILEKLKTAV